ncbi:DUF2283 domain-containing protein [Candidatus Woesearchaeota archaeon]|nr:DUF2283 domain-containing protein [Candidatus Woesearchaeota archaeon]
MVETIYDKNHDILNIQLESADYWKSVELPNGIVVDIAKNGKVIAIEIVNASLIFVGDSKKVIEAAAAA